MNVSRDELQHLSRQNGAKDKESSQVSARAWKCVSFEIREKKSLKRQTQFATSFHPLMMPCECDPNWVETLRVFHKRENIFPHRFK